MRLISSILTIISCFSIYVSYNVYFSHKIQRELLQDFNSGNYRESTTSRFGALNSDLPNLTVTSIPIKHLLSRYYFLGGDFEKALELIDQGFKANPYLQLGNVLKSEYYEKLEVLDSMLYYGNLAFDNSPRNIRHFMAKMKAVSFNDDYKELINSYEKVKDFNDKKFPLIFLSTLLTFEKIPDSIKTYVDKITSPYLNDQDVRVARDIVYYGTENVTKSIEYTDKADQFFRNGNLEESLLNYLEASRYNPGAYTNYENIGLIYNSQKKYRKSIKHLKFVIDSLNRPSPINGKSELILGDSYINLNLKDSACYYLNLSKSFNNKMAFNLYAKNCIN